jgi:hypothetical protein
VYREPKLFLSIPYKRTSGSPHDAPDKAFKLLCPSGFSPFCSEEDIAYAKYMSGQQK